MRNLILSTIVLFSTGLHASETRVSSREAMVCFDHGCQASVASDDASVPTPAYHYEQMKNQSDYVGIDCAKIRSNASAAVFLRRLCEMWFG